MSTYEELISIMLSKLYRDENNDLKLKTEDNNKCFFCDKKLKETTIFKLQFEGNEHEFYVDLCKKHLDIFNDDTYHYKVPTS